MIIEMEEILLGVVEKFPPNPEAYLTGDNLAYVKYRKTQYACALRL